MAAAGSGPVVTVFAHKKYKPAFKQVIFTLSYFLLLFSGFL
jgi:hypothetical protein